MLDIDPHSVNNTEYPLFQPLPDLTAKVNSFDDLNEKKVSIKSTADVT